VTNESLLRRKITVDSEKDDAAIECSGIATGEGNRDIRLYTWRKVARLNSVVVPGNGKNAGDRSS